MLVQNQKIKLNLCQKKILDYYKSKGYMCEKRKDFWVDVVDLKENSHANVEVICDYCGISYQMSYRHYIKEVLNGYIHKCACSSCGKLKLQEATQSKYGVKSTTLLKEVRDKQIQTCLKRYGVLYPTQSKEIQNKMKLSNLARYGRENIAGLKFIRDKIKQTSINKYGVECWLTLPSTKQKREDVFLHKYGVKNPFMCEEVKQKIHQTNINKYGFPNPMQNSNIANKARKTMYENNSVPTSKQQKHLARLFNGELNYPVEKYSIDIFIKPNIAIEYNGGGHDLQLKFGDISLIDFQNKEKARYYCLKRNGYKCITFINSRDAKYEDDYYLMLLDFGLHKLQEINVNWIEINLDLKYIKTKYEQLNLKEINELFK